MGFQFVYLTALFEVNVEVKVREPINLRDKVFITNNSEHIRKFLNRTDLTVIGSLEADLLLGGSLVVYRLDELSDPADAHIELVNFLREVQAILTTIWLLKDNSANCELGFAVSQGVPHIHSNSLALHYSTCFGERSKLELSKTELLEVRQIYSQHFNGIREQDLPEWTFFQKGFGRLNISLLFLQQARSMRDLGQKIANYCSFFEAILSTSSAELSHQLSERLAFLLAREPAERFELFKMTKRAYTIRSKVVHGDNVSKGQIPDLKEVAKHCDQSARELLRLILENDAIRDLFAKNESEEIDAYLLGRIFGVCN